jgi:hypothetical protein
MSAKQYSRVGHIRPRDGKTDHHVPPKHPAKEPRGRIIRKEDKHHLAYNLIFGSNCASFEMAVFILKRDWWTDENGNLIK